MTKSPLLQVLITGPQSDEVETFRDWFFLYSIHGAFVPRV
jgi:hypothetical protein